MAVVRALSLLRRDSAARATTRAVGGRGCGERARPKEEEKGGRPDRPETGGMGIEHEADQKYPTAGVSCACLRPRPPALPDMSGGQ